MTPPALFGRQEAWRGGSLFQRDSSHPVASASTARGRGAVRRQYTGPRTAAAVGSVVAHSRGRLRRFCAQPEAEVHTLWRHRGRSHIL